MLEGQAIFDGPLTPGYDGPEEDFKVIRLAMHTMRRRLDEASKSSALEYGSAGDKLLATQLRLDVMDALQCLRQADSYTPLLKDAVQKFFEACLGSR